MSTINLAPGAQYLAQVRRRRLLLFGMAGGLILILAGVWATFFILQGSADRTLQATDEQLQSVERAIAELGPDVERITLFEQRLAGAEALLQQHVNWAPLLTELERLLPAPTVLTSLKSSVDSGVIEVAGGTPNIDEVAQMIASLVSTPTRTTLFSQAKLQSVQRREDRAPNNAVANVTYVFNGSFAFDRSAIQAGLRTTP